MENSSATSENLTFRPLYTCDPFTGEAYTKGKSERITMC